MKQNKRKSLKQVGLYNMFFINVVAVIDVDRDIIIIIMVWTQSVLILKLACWFE